MHVTACLAGQKVDVEIGEDCRTAQALKEAIVKALPQLCVEGFDVSVGGRELDDEGVVSLEENVRLDVAANSRGLSVLALREAGREVSEAALFDAVTQSDVPLCTLLLDAGVPLDCVTTHGETPLHLSCRSEHLPTVTLLLDRGSAIDETNAFGDTPLHHACYRGTLSVVTLLLDRGSTAIDKGNHDNNTPLHFSCYKEHLSVSTLLLDRGSTAIDVKTSDGETPLHFTCHGVALSTATLLLDRGSRAINEKNCVGDTPLHISCRDGHLPLATLFLDRDSSTMDEKNNDGETPLHLSCDSGHLPLVTLLLNRGCNYESINNVDHTTVYSEDVVELLAKYDVLPDEEEGGRKTQATDRSLDSGCAVDEKAKKLSQPHGKPHPSPSHAKPSSHQECCVLC